MQQDMADGEEVVADPTHTPIDTFYTQQSDVNGPLWMQDCDAAIINGHLWILALTVNKQFLIINFTTKKKTTLSLEFGQCNVGLMLRNLKT